MQKISYLGWWPCINARCELTLLWSHIKNRLPCFPQATNLTSSPSTTIFQPYCTVHTHTWDTISTKGRRHRHVESLLCLTHLLNWVQTILAYQSEKFIPIDQLRHLLLFCSYLCVCHSFANKVSFFLLPHKLCCFSIFFRFDFEFLCRHYFFVVFI